MDHAPGEMSRLLAARKDTLSPKALSTLGAMAFLDPTRVHTSLFDPLRRLFTVKNEELKFSFPNSATAHKKACAELVKASLLEFSKKDNTYAMMPKLQTSVMADTERAGLIGPLFNGTVKVLSGLWPQMICIPDRTVDQDEYRAGTAPGTTYETYLKKDIPRVNCHHFRSIYNTLTIMFGADVMSLSTTPLDCNRSSTT